MSRRPQRPWEKGGGASTSAAPVRPRWRSGVGNNVNNINSSNNGGASSVLGGPPGGMRSNGNGNGRPQWRSGALTTNNNSMINNSSSSSSSSTHNYNNNLSNPNNSRVRSGQNGRPPFDPTSPTGWPTWLRTGAPAAAAAAASTILSMPAPPPAIAAAVAAAKDRGPGSTATVFTALVDEVLVGGLASLFSALVYRGARSDAEMRWSHAQRAWLAVAAETSRKPGSRRGGSGSGSGSGGPKVSVTSRRRLLSSLLRATATLTRVNDSRSSLSRALSAAAAVVYYGLFSGTDGQSIGALVTRSQWIAAFPPAAPPAPLGVLPPAATLFLRGMARQILISYALSGWDSAVLWWYDLPSVPSSLGVGIEELKGTRAGESFVVDDDGDRSVVSEDGSFQADKSDLIAAASGLADGFVDVAAELKAGIAGQSNEGAEELGSLAELAGEVGGTLGALADRMISSRSPIGARELGRLRESWDDVSALLDELAGAKDDRTHRETRWALRTELGRASDMAGGFCAKHDGYAGAIAAANSAGDDGGSGPMLEPGQHGAGYETWRSVRSVGRVLVRAAAAVLADHVTARAFGLALAPRRPVGMMYGPDGRLAYLPPDIGNYYGYNGGLGPATGYGPYGTRHVNNGAPYGGSMYGGSSPYGAPYGSTLYGSNASTSTPASSWSSWWGGSSGAGNSGVHSMPRYARSGGSPYMGAYSGLNSNTAGSRTSYTRPSWRTGNGRSRSSRFW